MITTYQNCHSNLLIINSNEMFQQALIVNFKKEWIQRKKIKWLLGLRIFLNGLSKSRELMRSSLEKASFHIYKSSLD